MRSRLGFAVVLSVAVAFVGACGQGDDRTPQQIVFASAAATEEAKSSKIALTVDGAEGGVAPGVPSTITAEGAFDFEANAGVLSMTMPLERGKPPADVEMRLLGNVMYQRFPPQLTTFLGGKPWLKIDLAALAAESGVDLGALSNAQAADPTQSLAQLRGVSDDVTEVGRDRLRGADVTHYRLTIDMNKAVEQTPEGQREALRKVVERMPSTTIPAEVWLDDAGRLRKMIQRHQVDGGESRVTLELFDFGTDVRVEAPPEDEVTDFSTLMSQMRGNAGATAQN